MFCSVAMNIKLPSAMGWAYTAPLMPNCLQSGLTPAIFCPVNAAPVRASLPWYIDHSLGEELTGVLADAVAEVEAAPLGREDVGAIVCLACSRPDEDVWP